MTTMTTETTPSLCPRDGRPLEVLQTATVELWACPECHGLRVEPAALEALVDRGESPPLRFPEVEVEPVEGTALCSCPGQPLMHRVLRHEDRLSFDVCPECGSHWFDAGELQCYLAERMGAAQERLDATASLPGALREAVRKVIPDLSPSTPTGRMLWPDHPDDRPAGSSGDFFGDGGGGFGDGGGGGD